MASLIEANSHVGADSLRTDTSGAGPPAFRSSMSRHAERTHFGPRIFSWRVPASYSGKFECIPQTLAWQIGTPGSAIDLVGDGKGRQEN